MIIQLPVLIDEDKLSAILKDLDYPLSGFIFGNGIGKSPTEIVLENDLTIEQVDALTAKLADYADAKTDYGQLASYRASLKTYMALASPTAAQSAAALKLVIRVLAILLDYLISHR